MTPMLRKTPNRTHAQVLVQVRTGKPVEQVLHEMYVEAGLSQAEIAARLGITRMTVAMWLREFGVSRTPTPTGA